MKKTIPKITLTFLLILALLLSLGGCVAWPRSAGYAETQETTPHTVDGAEESVRHTETTPAGDRLDLLTSTDLVGEGYKYVSGSGVPSGGAQGDPPPFTFHCTAINVVARAVKEMPGIYESLPLYGQNTRPSAYRLFQMEIMDPLESGMEGMFYYLLPAKLEGDLTRYDALLLSMGQLEYRSVLKHEGKLTAFDYLFTDTWDTPELGDIIPFSDGVFDESLWQEKSWIYGYQFGKKDLDRGGEELLVSRGSTLEEALARRETRLREEIPGVSATLRIYETEDPAVREALDHLAPFQNGVFVPGSGHTYRRYINGCATNEWVTVDFETGAVTASDYRFTAEDMEGLPNIWQYIDELDLATIQPGHTDPTGKILGDHAAVGWYEKTATGIYAVVRISWRHYEKVEHTYAWLEYYDETFLILEGDGSRPVTREELIALIGKNPNMATVPYGEGMELPMA